MYDGMDQSTFNAALAIYASSLATPFYCTTTNNSKYNFSTVHNGFNSFLTTTATSPPVVVGHHHPTDGPTLNCHPAQTPPTPCFPTPPNSAGGGVSNGSYFAGGNMLPPVANGIHNLFPYPAQWFPNLVNPVVALPSQQVFSTQHQPQYCHRTNSTAAEFSFEDALKKIQNAMYLQNCSPIDSSSPSVEKCAEAKEQFNLPASPALNNCHSRPIPIDKRNNNNNKANKSLVAAPRTIAANPTPCSNLATLAEVASRLSPEQPKGQSSWSTTTPTHCPAANRSVQSVPLLGEQRNESPLHRKTNRNDQTALDDHRSRDKIVVSWAELASQLLAAAEMQETVVVAGMVDSSKTNNNGGPKNHSLLIDSVIDDCVNKSLNETASDACDGQSAKLSRRNANRKRVHKRNCTPPSAPMVNSIEDTIDTVIRLQTCSTNSSPATFYETPLRLPPGHDAKNGETSSLNNEILDLSVKKKQRRSCRPGDDDGGGRSQSSPLFARPSSSTVLPPPNSCSTEPAGSSSCCRDHGSCTAGSLRTTKFSAVTMLKVDDNSADTSGPVHRSDSKEISTAAVVGQKSTTGRRVFDPNVVRLPLSKGWRRQTCMRSISASGVRGDVLYYSPWGRKFASIAEVARYLKKHTDSGLTADCFSFSSKFLAGDYFYASPEGVKNATEEDVRRLLDSGAAKAGVKFFATTTADRRRSPSLYTERSSTTTADDTGEHGGRLHCRSHQRCIVTLYLKKT